ncbi:dihydroxyacetone kinase phosphoryl donor subunit DhaM [Atopobacter phocae]|uniref:dihydroxyacetone kinase phosphoryl donor subunit DhaM n=1 Tax=Atopobacter phocae TaxID=136492 RepID=UPI0004710E42|nr:dihydroxyacetone kinase phosphoryl donor subunit DhaM [Atopobacter phocae]
MNEIGIIIVSHSELIAQGIEQLIKEVAPNVAISAVGGTEDGDIGTSFEKVMEAVESNPSHTLLTFFDLGSARMNLDMVSDMTEKEMTIYSVPVVEGAYTAAALLEAQADLTAINEQLNALTIQK